MNEFIEQFIVEARELVEEAGSALQTLERSPRDSAAIDALFRALHTLKGSAGIIDFLPMERALHSVESTLGTLRSGNGMVSAKLTADCFACLDLIVQWVDAMEQSGELPAGAEAQTATLLARLEESAPETSTSAAVPVNGLIGSADTGTVLAPLARGILTAQLALLDSVSDAIFTGTVAAVATVAANVLTSSGLLPAAELIRQACTHSLTGHSVLPLRVQIEQVLRGDDVGAPSTAATPRADQTVRTLRVDAERIETLVRLIGELTVVKNAIAHLSNLAQLDANPLATLLKDQQGLLNRITGEVQSTVLGMRVLPLRNVLGRFAPVVREMSAALGKPAKLIVEGDDTEADKAIVEMLFEPLLHVVRNALDHGIESPALRAQSNKAAMATLTIRAGRQGDRVLIEIIDDGRGIDIERIRDIAVERGVITREALAAAAEADIVDLVFAPGFSTAAKVTELSGRGVGMDAVRTAVGRLGGTVAIESRAGQGTTVRFSLPFSVMMTQVMTVEAGGQTFGIPLDAVIETISVPASALLGVGAAKAIAHRNRTLPVFELGNLLQVQPAAAPTDDEAIIVVTAFAGHWGGIRIDRPGERMEVMLKPLEGLLAGIPGITGTTIMGDGRVLLVLDLAEIL